MKLPPFEVWYVTGSQHLYGEVALEQVAANAQKIVAELNATGRLPLPVVFKPILTRPEEIRALMLEANHAPNCAGLILWMHTFSPAKMWIGGLEDLHGLKQLPGIAALVRVMKVVADGLPGGTSFMEDYTYHLHPDGHLVLGSHMLEICPSIAAGKPKVEVHPPGIGGKEDPVRLVFDAGAGAAINADRPGVRRRFGVGAGDDGFERRSARLLRGDPSGVLPGEGIFPRARSTGGTIERDRFFRGRAGAVREPASCQNDRLRRGFPHAFPDETARI